MVVSGGLWWGGVDWIGVEYFVRGRLSEGVVGLVYRVGYMRLCTCLYEI